MIAIKTTTVYEDTFAAAETARARATAATNAARDATDVIKYVRDFNLSRPGLADYMVSIHHVCRAALEDRARPGAD